MKEKELIKLIQLKASKLGARLFRNNVAQTWIGRSQYISRSETIAVNQGDVVIRQARRLHAGLCKGSCDLIGWTPVKITEAMLGREVAIFTGIEVKTGKQKATTEQNAFVDAVNNSGGKAGIVYDAEVVENMIGGLRRDGF